MNILEGIRNANEQIALAKAEMQSRGIEGLSEVAADIFKVTPGLNKFVVYGYTPGFNDGEPCTHRSCYGWGNLRYILSRYSSEPHWYLETDDIGDNDKFHEFLSIGSYEYPDQLVYANSDCSPSEDLDGSLEGVRTLCDLLFDTNFVVYFSKQEDGQVIVEQDDYACGW